MGRANWGPIVRILAGGYLAYLAINMLREFIQPDEFQAEAPPAWTMVFAIIFLIAGAFLIIISIKNLVDAQKEQWEELRKQREEAAANAAEQNNNNTSNYSSEPLSMTQITQYNSSTDDSDTEDSDDDNDN